MNVETKEFFNLEFRRAIGTQLSSKKRTMPTISFGKANRDYKVGTFKGLMATQPTQIRIQHPKFENK